MRRVAAESRSFRIDCSYHTPKQRSSTDRQALRRDDASGIGENGLPHDAATRRDMN
jgi:hypothetical protein